MERNWDCIETGNLPDTLRAQALTEIICMVLPPMLATHPRVEVLRNELRLQLAVWRGTDTEKAAYQAQVLQGLLQASGDALA